MSNQAQSQQWPERATTVLIGPSGLAAECWQLAKAEGVPFEYPGQGGRERRAGWTHQAMAQEIVDGHEGPLDVVGVSGGGAIVANLLLRHAARIRSAIIIGGEAVASADETPQQAAKRMAEIETRAGVALKKGMPAIAEDMLAEWFSPYALRADLPGVRFARDCLLNTDPQAWHDGAMAELKSEPVSQAALKGVSRPVTIIGAMHDRAGGLRNALQVHEMIPNSRLDIWPASRMMHLEQPENIRAILDRHGIWAPTGNRVEAPLGTGVFLNIADGPFGTMGTAGRPA